MTVNTAFPQQAVSFIVLLLLVVLPWLAPSFTAKLNNLSYDSFQRLHPRSYQDTPIKIVTIDDESLEKIGQFPWSRNKIAELISKLQALNAKVIALDIVFSEPDRTSPKEIVKLFPDNAPLKQLLKQLPDHDEMLIQALQQANVVTSFMLQANDEKSDLPKRYASIVAKGNSPTLKSCYHYSTNTLSNIENAAKGNATVSYIADEDGVVRTVPLFVCLQDRLYPTLGMEAVRLFKQQSRYLFQTNDLPTDNIELVSLADLPIQPSRQATIALHYSPSLASRYIPAWKVFANQVDKQDIENHIIFIGVSARGLQDLRFNPFGHLVAGVEVHAQLAEQLLQNSYLTRPDWESFATAGLLVLIWSIFSALNNKVSANTLVIIGLSCIALTLTSTWLAFTQLRLLIDPLFPSLSIILLFTVFFFQKQLKTEQEKRWLRTAFGRYVSPNRVDYLIKNPDSLVLGGEYRECSFVITDLTNFTALMEKLPPHECVSLLNQYLEGMIEIVFKYQGTLDRIVGDSVAVIFSAPILQPDHCQRALDCALAMDAYAMQFVSEQHAQGVAFGITRIGICTGNVLVGNFGGKIMFDYRALGDPINMASRLESANKQFGTRLCVGESTLNQTDYQWVRPIGHLVLKGKFKKIKAFELLTESEFNSALVTAYLRAYHKMEAGDASALADFYTLVECYPEDILSAYHYDRLHQYVNFARHKDDPPLSIDSIIVLANK